MDALVTISERLRALQAGTIAFSEIDVEWHKFQLRDNNIQKIFISWKVVVWYNIRQV
jgi:hypothetical protein